MYRQYYSRYIIDCFFYSCVPCPYNRVAWPPRIKNSIMALLTSCKSVWARTCIYAYTLQSHVPRTALKAIVMSTWRPLECWLPPIKMPVWLTQHTSRSLLWPQSCSVIVALTSRPEAFQSASKSKSNWFVQCFISAMMLLDSIRSCNFQWPAMYWVVIGYEPVSLNHNAKPVVGGAPD